jgi:hypothetical protein
MSAPTASSTTTPAPVRRRSDDRPVAGGAGQLGDYFDQLDRHSPNIAAPTAPAASRCIADILGICSAAAARRMTPSRSRITALQSAVHASPAPAGP